MKQTINLLLAVFMTAICCSIGNAQLIYSNNFSLGTAVNISNTPPTVANKFAGGTNTAKWTDVLGTNDPGALYANGSEAATTTLGDSFLLPFTPQSGYIYLLEANVTFSGNPGNWVGLGFGQNDTSNVINGYARFSDNQAGGTNSPRGSDWMILTESTGNVQYFAGPGGAPTIFSANGAFTAGLGTHTARIILNTKASPWSIAGYVDGVQMGTTNFTYASNPTIRAVGFTQNALTAPGFVQWNYLTFSATLLPFITQEPKSQSVASGSAFTNTVLAIGDTNGGPLSYQWYGNGVPLVNGGTVSGANTNVLVINPVSPSDAGPYYLVVSNNYGSATSSVATLTVQVNPVITAQLPITYTNPITLFGGQNIAGTNYLGSSPTFSVTAVGAQPLMYQWLTNGVAAAGATNASFTFTNCQLNGPTNFMCVVSNSYSETSNSWSAVYVPTPVAPYPQAVLAAQPIAFWRLNEPDNGNNNRGTICDDYQGANNGIYTNLSLGQTGYNPSEPTETSAGFGLGGVTFSYVGHIQGVDFAVTNGVNAEFTVEAWADCFSGGGTAGGAPVVSKGTYGVSDAFALGVDTNSGTQYYQFYVRSANGTLYKADSTIPATDLNWHHLVGVCDEASGKVSLYVDGALAASTNIPSNSGAYEVAMPVTFGAGIKSGATDYNLQFSGYIDDVAAYNYALGSAQVAAQYIAVSGGLTPAFAQTPPANVTVNAGATLSLPATLIGSAPLGYYWTDVMGGTNLATGTTNGIEIDASLTVSNVPSNWNGDQLELTVTNAYGSTNFYVTLNVVSGQPQIVTDVQAPFGAPVGGTASDSIVVSGSSPFYYQWQFNGANLVDNGRITGSQSSTLSIADAQLSDEGAYQVIVSNSFGSVTSSIAMLVIENELPISFNGNGLGWSANNGSANYATPAITNGLLTLTDGHTDQSRGFFFDYPQYIGAFRASFTYQAAAPAGYVNLLADGATFCLQNDPRGASAVGGIGGQLGIGLNGANAAITPSVELEFDIYPNNGLGGIGYCFQTNGAVGNFVAPGNVNLTNGPVDVSIYYAGGQVALTFSNEVSMDTFSTNLLVGDLTRLIGTNNAYVGFTGGSGGDPAVQTITNFSFASIPMLALQVSGNSALISWSGVTTGYTLQQNSDLTTTNWVNAPNQGSLTNGLYQATVPLTGSDQFYRLILQPQN